MIIRRKLLSALALCQLAATLRAFAQPQDKVRRIGFLGARSRSTVSNPDAHYDAFVQAMRELGYVEGKNLAIEWRFADGNYERFPALAAELVRMKPDVIVTHSTAATEALHRATATIPIVAASFGNPVGSGFAASLARPGGNITGLSVIEIDVIPKHVEMLKIMVPGLSLAAVLVNPGTAPHVGTLKNLQAGGQKLGVKFLPVEARTPQEIERGFVAIRRERVEAIIVLSDSFFFGQQRQITELAARNRLAAMYTYREDVEAGGLISYGPNVADQFRRAATYVDKILKGARPGELPIEQPTTIHLAINRKTAKALGITIPQELLLRADEVIE